MLLLGKSHENSIIDKDYVMPYAEISEAKAALSEMGFKGEARAARTVVTVFDGFNGVPSAAKFCL